MTAFTRATQYVTGEHDSIDIHDLCSGIEIVNGYTSGYATHLVNEWVANREQETHAKYIAALTELIKDFEPADQDDVVFYDAISCAIRTINSTLTKDTP